MGGRSDRDSTGDGTAVYRTTATINRPDNPRIESTVTTAIQWFRSAWRGLAGADACSMTGADVCRTGGLRV